MSNNNLGFATIAIHTGSGTRREHWRGNRSNLSNINLRAGRARQEQRLRVRAHAEPDAVRSRTKPRCTRGRRFGFAFASGMAAIDATLRLVKAGEHVVVSDNTYGGTARLFNRILANYNIEFDYVDTQIRSTSKPRSNQTRRWCFSKRQPIR